MDSWGTLVVGVEILLLVAGWLLFQQAKSDLTARAAQIPVMTEIKALQKSVATLIEQLKLESNQTSAQLEARCVEARELLAALDKRLEEMPAATVRSAVRRREPVAEVARTKPVGASQVVGASQAVETESGAGTLHARYEQVYALADGGERPGSISQQTGFSEGEVELILGLRRRAS